MLEQRKMKLQDLLSCRQRKLQVYEELKARMYLNVTERLETTKKLNFSGGL